MSSRSHIRPMASPTRPRPMMATVCPGPPPDVDARHLTEVILGALGRRMLGSSATDVGEPAVDIARAPAGRRGARRPKVPTQLCEIASKPNRSLSFCGPNFAKISPVGKPGGRAITHHATEVYRLVAPVGVQVIDQHRVRPGVVRSKRGRTRVHFLCSVEEREKQKISRTRTVLGRDFLIVDGGRSSSRGGVEESEARLRRSKVT